MLVILVISWCITTMCVLVHLVQHFKCRSYPTSKQSESGGCCHTKHYPQRRQNVSFFPVSFALYMALILILTSLTILKYTLDETRIVYISFHPLLQFTNKFSHIHWRAFTSVQMSISYRYIDYAIYALMIVAMIWESFFYFYRYYTTKITTFYLHSPTLIEVLKPFSFYCTIIVSLFVLQTQLYYYLFPVVIVSFAIGKLYWISQTTRIVIQSAELLAEKKGNKRQAWQSTLIENVLFMRDVSVICTICSCIYTSAFMVIYNTYVVYLFPPIWTISVICFLLQFIRNRRYLKYICCGSSSVQVNTPSQQGVMVEGSMFICVENIDKDKKIANQTDPRQSVGDKTTGKHHNTPAAYSAASLPISAELEPRCISYHPAMKFNSTGDLRSLLQKTKQIVPRNGEKQLPLIRNDTATHQDTKTFTSLSLPIPNISPVEPNDSTVSCDYTSNGRFPSIQLTVVDSGQKTNLNRHPLEYKATRKRTKSSETREKQIGSLQISVTQADYDHQDSRSKNILTVTGHRHYQKKSNTTSSFTRTPTGLDTLAKPNLLDKISDVTSIDYSWSGSNPPTPYDNNSNFTLAVTNPTTLPEMAESQMSSSPNTGRTPSPVRRGDGIADRSRSVINYLARKMPNPHNLHVQIHQRRSQPSISSVMQLFVTQGFSDVSVTPHFNPMI
eukprot:861883_1